MPGHDLEELDELDKIDDHYAEHLAGMDKSHDVVSSDDIVNDAGILLCKKGTRINHDMARKLIQHKLSQPLEDTISLSGSIDNNQLYKRLQQQFDRFPDCRQIHNSLAADVLTKKTFLLTRLNPLIIQKLTVINEQLPEQLDKAVVCAWLSLLIANRLRLDEDQQQQAYLAGLLHDIGFIHISPDILNKKDALTPEEWRAIQSHVVIGRLILEKYADIPAEVSRAVFEHHERCNGSGYPFQKNETSLGLLGQIVGAADSIYSIRSKQLNKHNRNMADLLPYLQMNSHTYYYDVYQGLDSLLKASGLQMTIPEDADIRTMADTLYNRSHALGQAIQAIEQCNIQQFADVLTDNRTQFLCRISNHVVQMSNESGLVREEMYNWLKKLSAHPEQEAIGELYEIELMLNELYWQLNNASRACHESLANSAANPDVQFAVREAYNTVILCLGELEDKGHI